MPERQYSRKHLPQITLSDDLGVEAGKAAVNFATHKVTSESETSTPNDRGVEAGKAIADFVSKLHKPS